MKSSAAGVVATGLGTVAWGFAAIFVKLATLSGLALPFYRLLAGCALMVAVALVVRRRVGWPAIRASVPGGVFFGADVALFFTALQNTSVANATFIGALQPVLVLLVASRMFGERLRATQFAWMALALGGVSVVVLAGPATGADGSRLGDLLAVGALLAWTGYWLASKRVRAHLSTVEYMTGMFLVASVVVTPLALVTAGGSLAAVHPVDWLWIGLLGVVPGTGHFLFNWAHRFVPATISSLVQAAVPVVATGLAFAILREQVTLGQVLGGLAAVTAIGAICVSSAREPAAALE